MTYTDVIKEMMAGKRARLPTWPKTKWVVYKDDQDLGPRIVFTEGKVTGFVPFHEERISEFWVVSK